MIFPLRSFMIGVNSSGMRVLHLAGCHHTKRYKTPPTYWWTDEHQLNLHCWLDGIGICAGCLPKKEIVGGLIPTEHITKLEPLLRQRRIEAVLA